jgi:hypothetical protein
MPGWLGSWIRKNMTGSEAPPPPSEPLPQDGWSRVGRTIRVGLIALLALVLLGGAGWYALSLRHHNWVVVVVAGDWHTHDGGASEAFDNARRDVSAELRQIGFNDAYMMQFSVRPDLDAATHPLPSTAEGIAQELSLLTGETPQGCLLYFSSHGAPQGLLLGNMILSPTMLANIVDTTCGDRPTVVILSACYSGVFVPALEGANRMIITAARADRTSFGCGQDNRYPYFDDCVVHTIAKVHSFPELADKVKDCVADKEIDTGMSPPSDPQIFIGPYVADNLPTW